MNRPIYTAEEQNQEISKECDPTMPRKMYLDRKQSYWWNNDIAHSRAEYNKNRRKYQQARKNRRDENTIEILKEKYKATNNQGKIKINKAKSDQWIKLCKESDEDVWRDTYRITYSLLKIQPSQNQLLPQEIHEINKVVDALFPTHKTWKSDKPIVTFAEEFTQKELKHACNYLYNGRAPGFDGLSDEIIKMTVQPHPHTLLIVVNGNIRAATIPKIWNKSRFVFLRKGDKPMEEPTLYRSLCLLNAIGKLLKQLLLTRIKKQLETPCKELSTRQYGFRKDRSSNHRVMAILDIAVKANAASWQHIMSELKEKHMPPYLLQMIRSYLNNHLVIYEANNELRKNGVISEVLQGSVMGPILWNVTYDGVLILTLIQPKGLTAIGFANNLVLVLTAKTEKSLIWKANIAFQNINNWLASKGLKHPSEISQAVFVGSKAHSNIVPTLSPCGIDPIEMSKLPPDTDTYGRWMLQKISI